MVVAATAYGKVIALDSSNGDVLWSQIFSAGDASFGVPSVKIDLFVLTPKDSGQQIAVVVGPNAGVVSVADARTRGIGADFSLCTIGRLYYRLLIRCSLWRSPKQEIPEGRFLHPVVSD